MTRVDADIDALREFHAALVRFRYSQRDVIDRAGHAIDSALASLSAQTAETDVELEGIRRWQQRVEEESSAYHGGAGRFRDLLEIDLPRAEDQLLTLIASLEACRTDPT